MHRGEIGTLTDWGPGTSGSTPGAFWTEGAEKGFRTGLPGRGSPATAPVRAGPRDTATIIPPAGSPGVGRAGRTPFWERFF
jgi:hypothetical protein